MTQDRSNKSRTLLLGSGPFAAALAREIKARPQCDYELVGMVNAEDRTDGSDDVCAVLGPVDELHSIILKTRAERIIVTLPRSGDVLPNHQLIEVRVGSDVLVEDGESVYEQLTGKLRIEALEPRGVIFDKDLKPSRFAVVLARVMSLACALAGVVLLAPLLALIALAVKLDSAGPVLFVQERVGLGGKPFRLLKFRTMHPTSHIISEWAGDNTHRITRVGRVLRKYRLDELPQFLNVLKGDMNIVGPRPHPCTNFGLFVLVSRNTPESGYQIPYYSLRSMVRPGITGWAQVRYQYANNLREEIEKLRFDLYYVKHYSIWLDLRIIVETIAVVLNGRGETTANNDDEEVVADDGRGPLQQLQAVASARAAKRAAQRDRSNA